MSPRKKGSAAALKGAPKSAVRSDVLLCVEHLEHVAAIARSAAFADDPERGAAYLVHALEDLKEPVARLRRVTRDVA